MQESSTAGLSLPSERIRIRTGLIVKKVGQGRSLLDARIAFAVMIEIDLDPKSNESGRNINKKNPTIRGGSTLHSAMVGFVLPSSGTEQAQLSTQDGNGPGLPGGICRY